MEEIKQPLVLALVRDLLFGVQLEVCPIVREPEAAGLELQPSIIL